MVIVGTGLHSDSVKRFPNKLSYNEIFKMNSSVWRDIRSWDGSQSGIVGLHEGNRVWRVSPDTPSLLGGEPYTLPYNYNLLSHYHMTDGKLQKANSSLDVPPMVIYVHMQTTAALHLFHHVSPVYQYLRLSVNYCIVLFINTRNTFIYIYLRWISSKISPSFSVILMLKIELSFWQVHCLNFVILSLGELGYAVQSNSPLAQVYLLQVVVHYYVK